MAAVKAAFAKPDGAKHALGYYRAFSFKPAPEFRDLLRTKTAVPTLVVCGECDRLLWFGGEMNGVLT